jgi:hypothetical protein
MHLLRLILDSEFQTIVLHPLRGPAASTRESTLFRNAVIDHNNSANEDPALRQPAASTREDTLVYATPPFQEGPRSVAQLLYMALDDELFKDVPEPQSPLQQSRHVPDAPFMSTELRRPSSLPQRQNKGSPPPGAICCRLARLAAAGGLPALSWSGVISRVRCSCIPCIALGEPFGRSGICPAAPLRSPGSTWRDTRDRSGPWKGGLNPIITYSAVPTCICSVPTDPSDHHLTYSQPCCPRPACRCGPILHMRCLYGA